ncbi:hypothetical protein HY630_03590 [Candidatus Uhrbacteria bacterium]|nr:hypothetical protein [Candidatus Uhrbacteria bacterium]
MSSKSLSAAAARAGHLVRSTTRPDGYRRQPLDNDTAGAPLFKEVEDRWSRLAAAIESVENHPLVKQFGFAPDSLITAVDTDFPVAMGFEVLSITLAACNAADELADLAGPLEVCKVLGWTRLTPPALKDFGADNLFRNAGALQARIAEIKAARSRPAPAKVGIKPRLALPTRASSTAPTPRALPPIPEEMPEESDWLGRVTTDQGPAYVCTCGCGVRVLESMALVPPFEVMRDRQNGRVKAADLWAHAFAPRCIRTWGRGFSLIETRDRAFQAEQEAAARRAPAPRAPRLSSTSSRRDPVGGVKRLGKTERDRFNKTMRASREEQK